MLLRFAKAHHQIPLKEKVGVALQWAKGVPPNFGFPFKQILVNVGAFQTEDVSL